MMRKLAWFVGLYGASVALFALVALGLRLVLK
jgi:hypothetical protein